MASQSPDGPRVDRRSRIAMRGPRPTAPFRLEKPRRRIAGRRGVSSMLATVYLVLFSTVAVALYTATAISAHLTETERAVSQAESAADGGMQFVRRHLGQLSIPASVGPSGLLDCVAQGLDRQLEIAATIDGHRLHKQGGVIYIPSANEWTVDPQAGTRFRAMIAQSGQFLIVTVDGSGPHSKLVRAVQVQYQKSVTPGAQSASHYTPLPGTYMEVVPW